MWCAPDFPGFFSSNFPPPGATLEIPAALPTLFSVLDSHDRLNVNQNQNRHGHRALSPQISPATSLAELTPKVYNTDPSGSQAQAMVESIRPELKKNDALKGHGLVSVRALTK